MLALLWNALVLFAAAAPHAAGGESTAWKVTSNGPDEAEFDPTYLLSDENFVDKGALSLTQIEAVLRHTPFHRTSCLSGYEDEDGVSAAKSIADAAEAHAISPIVLLARIQTEKSLLAKSHCGQQALRTAFGYACPDDAPCDVRFEGFRQQVWLGAQALREYLTELEREGHTRTGWEIGKPHRTKDGFFVMARNRATAALYTYTPWVGTRDVEAAPGTKARRRPFGNFLFWSSLGKLGPSVGDDSSFGHGLAGLWPWVSPAALPHAMTARRGWSGLAPR